MEKKNVYAQEFSKMISSIMYSYFLPTEWKQDEK